MTFGRSPRPDRIAAPRSGDIVRRRILSALAVMFALGLAAAACGDDDSSADEPSEPTTDPAADPPDGETEVPTATATPAEAATPTSPPEDDPTPTPVEAPMPEITGPITDGNGPVIPQPAAPPPDGYTVEEFFIGGTATSYSPTGETGDDGYWDSEPAQTADYRTRILVRRPPPEMFSGTVIVEWLNVSAIESSPDWAYLSEEIGRSGHAYVAVSAQAIGVVGGETILSVEVDEEAAGQLGGAADASGGLVGLDPERYGTLAHPGDDWAFDIFTQVGSALRNDAGTTLGGLEPTTILAVGESQSAGYLTTYLNAVHSTAGVYDGFLVHSRGASGAPLSGGFTTSADDDDGTSFVAGGVRIRDDLDVPVMILETETDLTLLGYHAARQPDTETLRTWEVAGTAHSDAHVFRVMLGGDRDGSLGSLLGCEAPVNTGPHKEAVSAATSHLVGWARGGPPPPTADRLELVEGDEVAIARDELGIGLGGVRNPLVDVPVVVASGDPPPGVAADRAGGDFDVCALFGQTIPLDRDTLIELHGSSDEYVTNFEASAAAAVEGGFLLPADAEALIAEAEANRALFE